MKQLVRDWRKVLSLLLIVALVLQISPVQAFAVGQDESADNSKVTYTYNDNGQLTSIKSPGDSPTYNFAYDKWGNNTEVKVGSQTLVENTYAANNGLLEKQTYGNGFVVGHKYDTLDRETSRSYNGATKFYWAYNADGNLARYTETGRRRYYQTL